MIGAKDRSSRNEGLSITMNPNTLKVRLTSLLATVLLTALPFLIAQAANPVNLWITNVSLIDRDGIADDVVVNILISDNKLKVITRDDGDG